MALSQRRTFDLAGGNYNSQHASKKQRLLESQDSSPPGGSLLDQHGHMSSIPRSSQSLTPSGRPASISSKPQASVEELRKTESFVMGLNRTTRRNQKKLSQQPNTYANSSAQNVSQVQNGNSRKTASGFSIVRMEDSMEDFNDPIVDDTSLQEITSIPDTPSSVEVPSRGLKRYMSTAHLSTARSRNAQKQDETRSRHFDGKEDEDELAAIGGMNGPRLSPAADSSIGNVRGTKRQKLHHGLNGPDHNGLPDVYSDDDLDKSPITTKDREHRAFDRNLIDQHNASQPTEQVNSQIVDDSSDDASVKRAQRKKDISKTPFSRLKSIDGKTTYLENRYDVLKFFSLTHLWLSEENKVTWSLHWDEEGLVINCNNGSNLPLSLNSILRVFHSTGPRIIIHKAINQDLGGSNKICIELASAEEAKRLHSRLSKLPAVTAIFKES